MFEEQTQKLYEGFLDKLNNVFSKKPFLATLAVSVLISVIVVVVGSDYKKGEAAVQVTNTGNDVAQVSGVDESDENKEIKVDLAGAVKSPGVYTLKVNSRLGDLLALGGGFVSETSALWVSKNLNLSQSVSDGQKVYIPFDWDIEALAQGGGVKALSLGVISDASQKAKVAGELTKMQVDAGGSSSGSASGGGSSGSSGPSGSSGSGSTSGGNSGSSQGSGGTGSVGALVNVNTATSSELDALPGIGPAYAGRIIENRPYASFDDFKEKSGLSGTLVENLKSLISF